MSEENILPAKEIVTVKFLGVTIIRINKRIDLHIKNMEAKK